ncbi:MAG: type II toxin-antitoxin system VapC family toxin [Dysgonamonadaceae bacterium]|jgi:PIN domain nuclease of toxin-antitoxin system|nr:type II toxin-antitoxin system VapC family toxin [Dysgonamonadaceae bacterium]
MERYLLDTNIVLFFLYNQKELEIRVLDIIVNDYKARLYVSTISIQEIIHLYKKKGKIKTTWKSANDILPSIEQNFEILPVKKEHLITYSKLSTSESHNDPNDHVIISQAIIEKMTLISSDHEFEGYVKQNLDLIFNSR